MERKKKGKRKLTAFLTVLVFLIVASDIGFIILYKQGYIRNNNLSGEENKNLTIIKSEERTLPKTYTVKLTADGFTPKELEINKGDTVTWINENVNMYDLIIPIRNKEFGSDKIFIGENYTYTFNSNGEFEYISAVTEEEGRITVK